MDSDYEISAYPVTYAQYEPFVAGDGYTNDDYWTEDGLLWRGDKRQPEGYWNDLQWHISNRQVTCTGSRRAVAYPNWLTAQLKAEVNEVVGMWRTGRSTVPTHPSRD